MDVSARIVSLVARTVDAPVALPSGPGHVKVTERFVASQASGTGGGVGLVSVRFVAATVYVTTVPFAITGSLGFLVIVNPSRF